MSEKIPTSALSEVAEKIPTAAAERGQENREQEAVPPPENVSDATQHVKKNLAAHAEKHNNHKKKHGHDSHGGGHVGVHGSGHGGFMKSVSGNVFGILGWFFTHVVWQSIKSVPSMMSGGGGGHKAPPAKGGGGGHH